MGALMTAGPASLDDIRDEAARGLYPQAALEGCADALVLFAAGFYGRQDAIWCADAGLAATCVDTDGRRLAAMEAVYPAGWEFVCRSAFEYGPAQDGRRQWDVVSLDPGGHMFRQCAALTPLWARLARRALIMGCGAEDRPEAPTGWHTRRPLWRSDYYRGGVYWAIFERAA